MERSRVVIIDPTFVIVAEALERNVGVRISPMSKKRLRRRSPYPAGYVAAMRCLAPIGIALWLTAPAFADPEPVPAPAPAPAATPQPAPAPEMTDTAGTDKTVGIGYKLGNGIGFFGGDVIVNPLPHLSIDLYGTYFPPPAYRGSPGTGYAFAPALQGFLREGRRSSPYVAVGMQYVHLAVDTASGSGLGVFANVGYEWKWKTGLGIQLGGGLQYLQQVIVSSSTAMVFTGGGFNPNLEAGIRYMFL